MQLSNKGNSHTTTKLNYFMRQFFKKTIYILAFCSTTLAIAGNPTTGCSIKITSKGLKDGSMCILACYLGDKNFIKDSAKSNAKGEVIFANAEKYDQGIYLFVQPNKKYFDFVMDAGQNFTLETDTLDFIKNMKVKGSEENRFFFEYQNFMGVKQKQIEPLRNQLKAIKDNKDSVKMLQEKIGVIDKEVIAYKVDFIKNNPKTFVIK